MHAHARHCNVACMHAEWVPARFAAALTEALKATGLSQGEIGRIAGVHRSQVSRWRRGEHKPDYDNVRRVALAMRQRGYDGLGQQLMTSAGYDPLPDDVELPPSPALVPEDDWEVRVLEDPELRPDDKRDIILRARRLRAELYPGSPPAAPASADRPERADRPEAAAG